jgi:hypothetical protein
MFIAYVNSVSVGAGIAVNNPVNTSLFHCTENLLTVKLPYYTNQATWRFSCPPGQPARASAYLISNLIIFEGGI